MPRVTVRELGPGETHLAARTLLQLRPHHGSPEALARQVEEVSESRTRLATAHLDERKRMERDLHDGAQQHLLAIALQVQSAQVNGDESVLRRTIAENGISSAVRAGAHVIVTSYDGAVYLVRPHDLEVVNVLRAMRQRVDEAGRPV